MALGVAVGKMQEAKTVVSVFGWSLRYWFGSEDPWIIWLEGVLLMVVNNNPLGWAGAKAQSKVPASQRLITNRQNNSNKKVKDGLLGYPFSSLLRELVRSIHRRVSFGRVNSISFLPVS
ncbi:hypothetical protein V6N13_048319 [Hibiscus sabdariffa]